MNIAQLISPKLTLIIDKENFNKKKVLEKISQLVSNQDEEVKYQNVLEVLQKREKIGNTGIGDGVAIPHARIQGLEVPVCVLLSLTHPINFSTQEEEVPVDLVFGLLVPETKNDEHLDILASLASNLKHKAYCERLRNAKNSEELYQAAKTMNSSLSGENNAT